MVLQKDLGYGKDMVFVEENSKWFSRLPKKVAREVKSFVKRNSLAVVACKIEDKTLVHCCCPKCLKAHLLRCIDENKMPEYRAEIVQAFACDAGHEGYYVDKTKMLKI